MGIYFFSRMWVRYSCYKSMVLNSVFALRIIFIDIWYCVLENNGGDDGDDNSVDLRSWSSSRLSHLLLTKPSSYSCK